LKELLFSKVDDSTIEKRKEGKLISFGNMTFSEV